MSAMDIVEIGVVLLSWVGLIVALIAGGVR